MASNLTRAEQKIRKLARVPGNTVCANCGNEKKFGWSSICIKYLTFVCNECKSSHQAISHRCKSTTMSAWTDEEVDKLEQQGGNDVARRTWLKHAPPTGQVEREPRGHWPAGSRLAVSGDQGPRGTEHARPLPG